MRHLPRRLHGLQRYRARPQGSERYGGSVERRPSGQYPSNTLVVQWRERINENGRLTADQPTGLRSSGRSVSGQVAVCPNGVRDFWSGAPACTTEGHLDPAGRMSRSSRHTIIRLLCRAVFRVLQLSGANRNDSQQALPLVDAIPLLQGERGRPRCRPDCVIGDRGYDAKRRSEKAYACVGLVPDSPSDTRLHGSGLGRYRWVVERTFAWLNQFRRLRVRYEKRSDIHQAFLSLACALICWHFLRSVWMSI